MQQPKPLTVNRLIQVFRTCLLAVAPHMEEVGVTWRDGEAYDDWDRTEEALFKSIVSMPVVFTPSEGASRPLPRYKAFETTPCSELFDAALGLGFTFFGLEQTETPFDTVRFQSEEEGVEDILKLLDDCQFLVLLRASRSTETSITDTVQLG